MKVRKTLDVWPLTFKAGAEYDRVRNELNATAECRDAFLGGEFGPQFGLRNRRDESYSHDDDDSVAENSAHSFCCAVAMLGGGAQIHDHVQGSGSSTAQPDEAPS